VLGIVNVVGSAIARETDAGIYNHAGPEMSVASTKAFLSQITILALLAISLGRDRGLSRADAREYLKELEQMPEKIERVLASRETVARIAKETRECKAFAFMGRTEQYPIAKEGALKLKELAYVSAEGYPAGEMKHGPIATVDETLPIIAFAPQGSVYEKMLSNIEEIQARNGKIITIGTEGDDTLPQKGIAWIPVPETKELFTPFLTVVPVQLFAYYSAIERGKNVDRPRNLAKSVTVE
jgi:glucosamine--fructose-6-phosphate aminotransferase (isomerizing)